MFGINEDSPWQYTTGKLPVLKGLAGQSDALPSHISQIYFAGSGNEGDPYLIYTVEDLAKLTELVNDGSSPYADAGKYYQLENNLDLSAYGVSYDGGKGWTPIGKYVDGNPINDKPFRGTFNGNGKVISGLYIDRSSESYQGLFGYVDGGKVCNLGVTDVNIIGSYFVGGVVGQAKSGTVVENCYSTGSVRGIGDNVGGVVGYLASGTVKNCYSSASVSGSDSVGGVVGYVNGSGIVQNCVALNSSVSLTAIGTSIGRVAGNVAGTLSHNYAFSGIPGTWNNKGLAEKDGQDIAAATLFEQEFWTTTSYWNSGSWNDPGIWITADNKLPVLKDLAGQSDDGGLHLLIRDIQYATVNVNGTYTYTGSPITPDLTVTFDGKTLTVNTDYTTATTSIDESTTSAGTNAGVVTLTLTGIGNFTGTVEKEYTIAKAGGPAAPTGLAGAAPSSIGGADGKITGTTVAMEYARNPDFSDGADCTDSETVGLSAGTYYVRIKASTNYEAGAYATVTVPEGSGGPGSSSSDSGSSGDSGSQVSTPTTPVSGQVIDSTTGKVLQGLTAQASKAADGTAVVQVKSQEAVVFKQQDGTPSSISDVSKLALTAENNQDAKISISADGTIEISNLAPNTQSRFAIQLDFGNGKITIGYLEVKVDASGNVTGVSSTLIDPYGTIIDAATGEKIVGAHVTLYYADTERNKQKGIVAHTPVNLPILNGFEPNNNKNPQYSDKAGFYAFMVFPEADYYLLASKEGYEDYKSMTISVEQEIVKWDFKMFKPLSGVQRLAGANRVDTALAIAQAAYSGKLKNAVLTTAANYPDALAGSVLAYKLNAPILLVGSSAGDQQKVIDYLKSNLDPSGTVYILGGTGAVGQDVESKLKGAGFSKISRLSGSNRSETALKIAGQIQVPTGRPVILVNEGSYADALSISSSAAAGEMPIFLTGKDKISGAVRQKIAEIKPIKVYLIGGEGVLSAQVAKQVAEITGLSADKIVRLSGADRYATSLTAAKHFNLPGQSVSLATGRNFPDALAGGVFAANYNAPILLVNDALSTDALTYLESKSLTAGVLLGGEGVLSKQIEQELARLLERK